MMSGRTAFIAAGLGLVALRLLRGAQRPGSRVTTLDPIHIYGRVPTGGEDPRASTPGVGGVRRPLSVRFDVRVSGIEKWAVSAATVQQSVQANAASGIMPGSGTPNVRVSEIETGYVVTVSYPDSYGDISAMAAQRAIEGVDPRLEGRIANVMVNRA